MAPPIFVLAPLLAFLLLAPPRTLRAWWWIAGVGAWLATALSLSNGLADYTLSAWAIMAAGAFAVIGSPKRSSVVETGLVAAAIGLLGVGVWASSLGVGWREFQLAVAHDGWEYCRTLLGPDNGLEARFGAARAATLRTYVNAMADGVETMAQLFPGLMLLLSLPGFALAGSWSRRITGTSLPGPGGFGEFRFNDQLVWGAVLGVGLVVFPLPDPAANVGRNLVLVFGGLYLCRGVAVAWSQVRRYSGAALMAIALSVLFLRPVALGGLISLGLADTWLDFRRRLAPSSSGE